MGISISFVIPCYNASTTIVSCLDSIFSYPDADIECILVDDLSKDNTVSVINNYLEQHPAYQIKLIKNHHNLGAGETRNVGIGAASKDFITFVDADDQIDAGFYDELLAVPEWQGKDCIVFDATFNTEGKNSYISMLICNNIDSMALPKKLCLAYIKGSTWGKIYKTEIIQKNNIRFAALKRNEDLVFTKRAVALCDNIYYLHKSLYIYNDVATSLMHNASLLDENNAYRAFALISESIDRDVYKAELNFIYLLEVVYSTTRTLIKKGASRKELAKHFEDKFKEYDKNDIYYSGLPFKYKIVIQIMRLHLFPVLKIL